MEPGSLVQELKSKNIYILRHLGSNPKHCNGYWSSL